MTRKYKITDYGDHLFRSYTAENDLPVVSTTVTMLCENNPSVEKNAKMDMQEAEIDHRAMEK